MKASLLQAPFTVKKYVVSCRWRHSQCLARHTRFLVFLSICSKHLRKWRAPGINDVTSLTEEDTHAHRHKNIYRGRRFSFVVSQSFISSMAVAMVYHPACSGKTSETTHRFLHKKWIYILWPVSLETNNKYSKASAAPTALLEEPCFLLQIKWTALFKGHGGSL